MEPLLIWFTICIALTGLFFLAEMFIPSMGLLSLAGGASLLATIVLAFFINTWLGVALLVIMCVALPFLPDFISRTYANSRIGRSVILTTTAGELDRVTVLIGSAGVTMTELRPMGECEFATGVSVECKSEMGRVIPAGRNVKVIALDGTVAVVREMTAGNSI